MQSSQIVTVNQKTAQVCLKSTNNSTCTKWTNQPQKTDAKRKKQKRQHKSRHKYGVLFCSHHPNVLENVMVHCLPPRSPIRNQSSGGCINSCPSRACNSTASRRIWPRRAYSDRSNGSSTTPLRCCVGSTAMLRTVRPCWKWWFVMTGCFGGTPTPPLSGVELP